MKKTISYLIYSLAIFNIFIFSLDLQARNFLEGFGYTATQIKQLQTCSCEINQNGKPIGQVSGLKDVVDNSLIIFDKGVLNSLEDTNNSFNLSLESIMNNIGGDSVKLLSQISNGMNTAPLIGLPTEEITSPPFASLIKNPKNWELHNIVFRPDLNSDDRHGEMRLIYKAKETTGVLSRIIFEFKLPKSFLSGTTLEITDTEWSALFSGLSCLKNKDFFNYVSELRHLISLVVASKFTGLPCGSALGQLRINDFSNSRWILAEFGLSACNLVRKTMPLTPPDNFYQEPNQSIRSGNQQFFEDELFKLALVQYLQGLRESPVIKTSAMQSDFGSSSWMRGIIGGDKPNCVQLCKENVSVSGCNCQYLKFISANGINLTDPEVINKAQKFSMQTCNSCHSSCTPSEGCGGVSFFHTEDDGRPGKFMSQDNGEKNFDGKPVGDISFRLEKMVQLLLQPGNGDNTLSKGICNAGIECNFDYNKNGRMDSLDFEHHKTAISSPIKKIQNFTYDLNGDGLTDKLDSELLKSFLSGKITAGDAFKNPQCDTFVPDFTLDLSLCDRIRIFGDANRNGNVTAADISLLRKFILGVIIPDPNEKYDVSGDGKLSTLDIVLIQKFILGKIDCGEQGLMLLKKSAQEQKNSCNIFKSLDLNKNAILEFNELRKENTALKAIGDIDRNNKLTSGEINFLGDVASECPDLKSIDQKILFDNPDPVVKLKTSKNQER